MKRRWEPASAGAAGLLTIPLSWMYGAAARARLLMYSAGILPQRRVPGVRVISIGNLTAGGTGKTPVAIMVAGMTGPGTAIVSRGYGRRSREAVQVVSDGAGKMGEYPLAADEALVCAHALKNTPVICAPERVSGIARAKEMGATTVVLDDAFSHLAAARDRNLLLVDALDPFGGGRLLPAGRLREPLSSAARADAVLVTRANMADKSAVDAIRAALRPFVRPDTPFFRCAIVADGVTLPSGERVGAKEYLAGRKVRLLSGIASPRQFGNTVKELGGVEDGHFIFADHHPYSEAELEELLAARRPGETLLTTQKDFVRLPQKFRANFAVLGVRAEVEDEGGFRILLGA